MRDLPAARVMVAASPLSDCLVWFSRWLRERRRRAEQAAGDDQQRRDLLLVRSGMAAVDQMSGVEFEEYVAAKLRQCGWQVSYTPVTGDYPRSANAHRWSCNQSAIVLP